MKVVILAGGYGSRLSEYTKTIPKPMVKILGKPIIHRIIDHYVSYGHQEFYIALGYKGNELKKYFLKKRFSKKIKINLIDTGKNTMTGGRLKRLEPYLKDTFLMTYGDGLSNIHLNKLIDFHKKNKKIFTLTAVRPPARFGSIKIKGNYVNYFKEKNNLDEGWINGGFFVIEPKFFKYLKSDKTFLEREPFEKLTKIKELVAYKHDGFWQCMDTLRDKEILEKKLKIKYFLN
ncbi:sugar phosphate nucleotidyltransferase [Candidatus Pelagibacter ubique]|jgi:glucose-1-phosphate cytidylyltransferase|nr:sugar phosphate nucleotidyltransferase [Candidatus Pelagibacter ubique]